MSTPEAKKDGGADKGEKGEAGGGDGRRYEMRTWMVIGIAVGLYLLLQVFEGPGKEITWREFRNDYLERGLVERIEVVNKRFARVVLKSGSGGIIGVSIIAFVDSSALLVGVRTIHTLEFRCFCHFQLRPELRYVVLLV